MSAVNKSPWYGNLNGALQPLIIVGKVQAGSTQAIKRGEICTFNETSGYFIPADAVADNVYSLAIANEEQKADSLERYMQFIAMRYGDVFEFELAAARAVLLGDPLALTASNSQQLTYDADGFPVAFSVGAETYPSVGTTTVSQSHVRCCFNPAVSYLYKNVIPINVPKILHKTASYTITAEDNGAIITNKGASGSITLTAPAAVFAGFNIKVMVAADQVVLFDPKPDTASVYIKGDAHTAGNTISCTDIGDFFHLVFDGTDWLAVASISGADGDITLT